MAVLVAQERVISTTVDNFVGGVQFSKRDDTITYSKGHKPMPTLRQGVQVGNDLESDDIPTDHSDTEAEVHEDELYASMNTDHDTIGQSEARDVSTGWITHQGTTHIQNEDRVVAKHLVLNSGMNVSILGVFDGHGGDHASEFASNKTVESIEKQLKYAEERQMELTHSVFARILHDAFFMVDKEYNTANPLAEAGTCALIVVVADNVVYSSNTGDCEAFLVAFPQQSASDSGSKDLGPKPSSVTSEDELTLQPEVPSTKTNRSVRRLSPSKFGLLSSSHESKSQLQSESPKGLSKSSSTSSLKGMLKAARRISKGSIMKSTSKSVALTPSTCEALTAPHNTSNPKEVERVLAAGGRIENNRVGGSLLPTRALGDGFVKNMVLGVIAEPEVRQFQLTPGTDVFLILGTDGLWDFTSKHQAFSALNSVRKCKGTQPKDVPTKLAQNLKDHSLTSGRPNNDDVSVLVAYVPVLDLGTSRSYSII
ncbi:hypothetical protein SARC_10332 [Sphaeroforma arctica JP610]|uniref:PPM-type phosphatase domain-containing protein n=1 Tax=Sphaeroforma arctica JP610 TaxID=667725 RepID=A0A0L0FME8_9EUKA|nr:hypothetical protein SARC_10332 [Sphaeroforma arctica JP610]KNC77203.1 hypothetical protein SARC_10332 [Sphaeroforma arctica JP610]|eukprot:XP_014151105.1 hypothetical protein SARC_10332 [Sphaeroforma arctica JP610]